MHSDRDKNKFSIAGIFVADFLFYFLLLFNILINERRQQKWPSSFRSFWRFSFRWTKFAMQWQQHAARTMQTKKKRHRVSKRKLQNKEEENGIV